MKHCETLHQTCPNDPSCKGCEALEQRNSDGSHAEIDMASSWRDYVCLLDIVGAVALIVVAGWASSYFYRG